jgi:hypothetical protein
MEIPMIGRRTTLGVARVSHTVLRPQGPRSSFVHQLLIHLDSRGFDHAPKFLGIDSKDREVFLFADGTVPLELGHFSDEQIAVAAQLIREYHDATASSVLSEGQEVVCHHDLSPCNFVFENDVPIAMIDFDSASPGSRLEDLSQAIWYWLDIGSVRYSANEQGRRIRLFLESYGYSDFSSMLDFRILNGIKIEQGIRIQRAQSQSGQHAFAEWASGCLDWVEENEEVLEDVIGCL